MTDNTHDTLRQLAQAATPGPWRVAGYEIPANGAWQKEYPDQPNGIPPKNELHIMTVWIHGQLKRSTHVATTWQSPYYEQARGIYINDADAAYIAAANPAAVLGLLDELAAATARAEAAERDAAQLRAALADAFRTGTWLHKETCSVSLVNNTPCDCGLAALRLRVRPLLAAAPPPGA
jgi:hypothetical protein